MSELAASAGGREVVGLVGVGLVGAALAEHLLARGFGVAGCDVDPGRCSLLSALGGAALGSPAEVAGSARRVFLSLMTSDVVREVVEGPRGLLEADPAPECIIDTTTGDPDRTEALGRCLAARGVRYVDATISGSSQQIRDREALFMLGGDGADLDACADLIEAVAGKTMRVGPSGSGARAKLASNLVLGLNRLALAEGLAFAESIGLDPHAFLALLRESPAYARVVDTKGEKMVRGDFAPQARLAQHRKDVALILAKAEAAGQSLPVSRLHIGILDELIASGDGDLDCSAVIEALRRARRS